MCACIPDLVHVCMTPPPPPPQIVMEVGVGSGVVLRCLAGETLTQRMLAADLAADGNANFMALNTEVNNRYMSSGSTFQIMNLEAGDEGLYRCTGPDMMTFCVLAISKLITRNVKCMLGFVRSPKSLQF